MKHDNNSERQQSIRLGFKEKYIAGVRRENIDKYNFILTLSQTGYFEDGYLRYVKHLEKVLESSNSAGKKFFFSP